MSALGSLLQALDLHAVERGRIYRKPHAQVVEQDPEGRDAPLRRRSPQRHRRCGKCRVVICEFVERDILGTEEAELFKVRVSEAPATPLIDPEPMQQHRA